jgi:retron-type reverse transcriptase
MVSSNYWSSTTNANNTDNAWNVNFNNGNDNWNNKSNNNYVRAVRGGECSLLSFRVIYDAYLDCRRRKRGTINALRFEANLMENLFDLALDLQKGRYLPSRSVCFVTRSPKLREIFAADFRDRIVHHLVVRELEKTWDPRFIYDSYASRKGKGIHAAVDRLQGFMQKATRSGKRAGYFLQLDIRSFFMSIDKRILYGLFESDPKTSSVLRWLLGVLIFHDPTTDYYFKGDRGLLNRIPSHKSLFGVGPDKGLPIGNLTSQFFANVYLNELDQFVKHELRCRFYLRYVDDFILLSEDPNVLPAWRDRIADFLNDQLALRLKELGKVRRVSEGADFLGYITRPNYRLVRRRVVNNLKYVLAKSRDRMVDVRGEGRRGDAGKGEGRRREPERGEWVRGEERRGTRGRGKGEAGRRQQSPCPPVPVSPGTRPLTVRRLAPKPDAVYHLRQVLSSYLGHCRHANSHRLVQGIFEKNPWLGQVFLFRKGKLILKSAPTMPFATMRAQVGFFRRQYPGFVLFFRVGRYVELYGRDGRLVSGMARLKWMERHRGVGPAVGFPLKMASGMRRNLLAKGYRTAMIAEGEVGGAVKRRYVQELAFRR